MIFEASASVSAITPLRPTTLVPPLSSTSQAVSGLAVTAVADTVVPVTAGLVPNAPAATVTSSLNVTRQTRVLALVTSSVGFDRATELMVGAVLSTAAYGTSTVEARALPLPAASAAASAATPRRMLLFAVGVTVTLNSVPPSLPCRLPVLALVASRSSAVKPYTASSKVTVTVNAVLPSWNAGPAMVADGPVLSCV